MRTYATLAEYKEFADQPPADDTVATKRLAMASHEVDTLTRGAAFVVDADGYPTDQTIREAFKDATCAVVAHWDDTDDPRGTDALEGAVKIGSVSLGTTSSSQEDVTGFEKTRRRLGDLAIDILINAGLLDTAVAHT